MTEMTLQAVNMSINAGILILAVMLFRLILRNAPKKYVRFIWAFVGIRLVFPFAVKSSLSLIPSAEPLTYKTTTGLEVHTAINTVNENINSVLSTVHTGLEKEPVINPAYVSDLLLKIWLGGIALMLLYAFVSYIAVRIKVRVSIKNEDGVYLCDNIPSPFVLGVIKPKIYIPSSLSEDSYQHVLLHERTHIAGKDNIIKPFAFFLLSVYWFNPLVWVAFILFCRDTEAACDEKAIKDYSDDMKKEYASSLLSCAVGGMRMSACPVAFGENGVKQRIKAVMKNKKPAVIVSVAAVILAVLTAACFLTDPVGNAVSGKRVTDENGVIFADCILRKKVCYYDDMLTEEKINQYISDEAYYAVTNSENLYIHYTGDPFYIELGKLKPVDGEKFFTREDVRNALPKKYHSEKVLNAFMCVDGEAPYTSSNIFIVTEKRNIFYIQIYKLGYENEELARMFLMSPEILRYGEKGKTYRYKGDNELKSAGLLINENEGTFVFNRSPLDSFIEGGFISENTSDILILESAKGDGTEYHFTKQDGKLIFNEKASSPVPEYKYSGNGKSEKCIPDGAEFVLQ